MRAQPHGGARPESESRSELNPGVPTSALSGSAALLGGSLVPLLALFALGARWLWLTGRYSVNVLFYDQYDFLRTLAAGASPWELFTQQFGPHRLGLGYLATAAVYRLTSWNVRAECFVLAGATIAIAAVGLTVKRRALGPLRPIDVCIPIVALAATQFEQFAGAVISAHGPIPVLLVVCYAWLELSSARPARVALQVALVFCAVFTGFGLFLAPPAAALFALGAWRDSDRVQRWIQLAAAACVVGSVALFLRGYTFQPAVSCFGKSEPAWRYAAFTAVLLGRPFTSMSVGRTIAGVAIAAAAALLWIAVVAAAAVATWRSRGRDATARCALALATFSGLFAASTAIGRLCLGIGWSLSSRYVVYVTPAYLAAHLMLHRIPRPALRGAAFAVVLALLAVKEVKMSPADRRWLEYYASGKSRWRACYLEQRDARACDRATGFEIYPGGATDSVQRLLDDLEGRGVRVFGAAPRRGG